MTREMEKNVTDSDLREWITPSFSTTTANDTIIASILMLGTVQEFYSYTSGLFCEFPSFHHSPGREIGLGGDAQETR